MTIEKSCRQWRTIQGYSFGKSELLSNTTTVDSALNYIRSKQQSQSEQIITTAPATTTNKNRNKLTNTGGRQTVLKKSETLK
jgi:hypothetical protein